MTINNKNTKPSAMPESVVRLQFLLEKFNPGKSEYAQMLTTWLRKQPPAGHENELSQLAVSTTSDFKKVTVYSSGEPHQHIEPTVQFLTDMGVKFKEKELLTDAGELIMPGCAGTWMTASDKGVDGGWFFQDEISFEHALSCVSPSEDKEILAEWGSGLEEMEAVQIRRSVGEPEPMTELFLLLPDERGLKSQMLLAEQLFTKLKISWLDNSIVDIFLEYGKGDAGLLIALTAEGVSRMGIVMEKPPVKLVLALSAVAKEYSDEKLAQWEGILGAEGPGMMAFSRSSRSMDAELYYLI